MDLMKNNYKKGDPFPPRVNKSMIRIYSRQFCPFTDRLRLVLAAKGIEHEIINVNLDDKPEWLLERNPKGSVPVMEFDSDDKVITESLIASQYLDEVFAGRKLQSNDPYIRAKDLEFIERVSPHFSNCYKQILLKEERGVLWTSIQESLKKVEQLLVKRKTQKFLSGDSEPGFVDYMIWPMIERIPTFIDVVSDDIKSDEYLRKQLPTIYRFRNNMLSDSTVENVCYKYNEILNHALEKRKMVLAN